MVENWMAIGFSLKIHFLPFISCHSVILKLLQRPKDWERRHPQNWNELRPPLPHHSLHCSPSPVSRSWTPTDAHPSALNGSIFQTGKNWKPTKRHLGQYCGTLQRPQLCPMSASARLPFCLHTVWWRKDPLLKIWVLARPKVPFWFYV